MNIIITVVCMLVTGTFEQLLIIRQTVQELGTFAPSLPARKSPVSRCDCGSGGLLLKGEGHQLVEGLLAGGMGG